MRNSSFFKALIIIISLAAMPGISYADESLRIDGASDEAANKSWLNMLNNTHGAKKQQLMVAFAKLSLEGYESAFDIAAAGKSSFPAADIKDKIAGLTADEIIELANQSDSTISAEVRIVPKK